VKAKVISVISLAFVLLAGISVSPSSAAANCDNKDRLYYVAWTNTGSKPGYVFTNCPADTTFHSLNVGTANISADGGLITLDPASGKAYVTDWAGRLHEFSLDETTPGSTLAFTGEALNNPWGVVFDPAAKRLYIANYGNGKLLTATLKDRVLSEIDLTAHGLEDLDSIDDLRIDTATKRIYISDDGYGSVAQQISWISTNSNAGGKLNLGTATQNTINGFAFDKKQSKVYWTNFDNGAANAVPLAGANPATGLDTVEYVNPDGDSANPQQIVVDESTGGLYWSKYTNIYKAGSLYKDSTLFTTAESGFVNGLALLKAPQLVSKPKITITKTKTGNVIKCVAAVWEKDRAWSGTFDAPKTVAMDILRDGVGVKRYTAPFTTKKKGTYTCRSKAVNVAGTTLSVSTAKVVTK
jgi:DNA-binding beta-propeller fold protein YncE